MLRVEYHEARYACRLIRGAMTKLKVAIGCHCVNMVKMQVPSGRGVPHLHTAKGKVTSHDLLSTNLTW